MKLTILILVTFILQVSARTYAQKITLAESNAPLDRVFKSISDQTGYDFLISTANLKQAKLVTINIQGEELKPALDKIFKGQPLSYVIQEKMVVVSKKEPVEDFKGHVNTASPIEITGRVTDSTGSSLPGATIKIKGNNKAILSDKDGRFAINVAVGDQIQISFIGYQTYSYVIQNGDHSINIVLHPSSSKLNEIQVIGYGTTTKLLNTGSVSTISSKEIEKQPVTNVLSALSGCLPGVFLQTANGLPGGNINIQIRGKGSITAGTNPLFIIDGVPFDASSVSNGLNNSSNSPVNGVVNPLNSINPGDIETISVLKDADATSIYGSRGSNGVVLITTKKGQQGDSKVDINVTSGVSMVSNFPALLGLDDYLAIRKEAFANDKITPTAANGFDLLAWPQNQSTDWGKYLFGNKANYTDITGGLSGGSGGTTFRISSAYHQEANGISDKANYRRGSLYFSMRHQSANKRLDFQMSNALVLDNNTSPNIQNVATGLFLAPNFPLLDQNGAYTVNLGNPLRDLNASAFAKTNNNVSSVSISYELIKDLRLKLNGGYSKTDVDQVQLFPLNSLQSGTNYTLFNQNTVQSFIAEPQVSYVKKIGLAELNVLAGGTYQEKSTIFQAIKASNFNNEGLMQDLASANTIDTRANNETPYKYASVFGRATINLRQKYILNATVRRDGSTRFGAGNRFGNFGSVGAAWIFSEEEIIKDRLPFISYGKLRGSYGTTGNDQITDYQYLSTYTSQSFTYQGISTQAPSRIANTDFHWETTKKIELALEFGFIKNRLLITADYYRNRSSDQLVNYSLPSMAGFTSYQANLPAVIQNSGWEFELNTTNIQRKSFIWSSTFNITIPRNKLVSFQNFETSAYAQTYDIGYDINIIKGYRFLGVDAQTGNGIYQDINGNPTTIPAAAYNGYTIGKRTPDFYGGLGNTLKYRNITFDLFFQFTKQISFGGIRNSIGLPLNNYALMISRWQKPGDVTNIPKASTVSDSSFPRSSAGIFDGSYVRLKNVSLSYELSPLFNKNGKTRVNVFVRGENVLTFYNNKGAFLDPESGGLYTNGSAAANIPPTKSFVAGIQLNF